MLARFALRVAAVEALRGRTLAENQITDSRISAIDIAQSGELRVDSTVPFVDCYTDDSEASDLEHRELRQNGMLRMNFESGITSTMTETDPQTKASYIVGVQLPAADDSFEATLDLLNRQIVGALSDPNNEWAEVWRKLSDGVEKVEHRRIASADDGTRRAARQMSITLKAKPDPVVGQTLAENSVWARFRALVARDREDLLAFTDQMIGPLDGETDYATIQIMMGHTRGEMDRMGYGPAGKTLTTIKGYEIDDARAE